MNTYTYIVVEVLNYFTGELRLSCCCQGKPGELSVSEETVYKTAILSLFWPKVWMQIITFLPGFSVVIIQLLVSSYTVSKNCHILRDRRSICFHYYFIKFSCFIPWAWWGRTRRPCTEAPLDSHSLSSLRAPMAEACSNIFGPGFSRCLRKVSFK